MQIQELLNTGRNNAVSARYLCGITGLDRRTLSAAIARERKHGAAICAATEEPAGFFIAANADELASYCRSLASSEKEIAALLVEGLSNRQIADRLYISEGTVKNYISAIYDKTGIHDRVKLVVALKG